MQKLYEDYSSEVDFFWIYSQEARASDTGLSEGKDTSPLKSVKNHRTMEERKISAQQCAKETGSKIPQLLDDLDHSVSIRYYGHPTRLYVIGKNNKVAYAGKLGPFGTDMEAFTKAVKRAYKTAQ